MLNTLSFYKKALPDTCIAFHSEFGKSIFVQALNDKFMECYFRLSLQFLTQSEPAFCGLASLCMVLNSLEVDPLRQWKGIWRWYSEEMLDCCRPLELVKQDGITLPEFCCLAKCNGLQSTLHLAEDRTKQDFLNDLLTVCASTDTLMVISFARSSLQQTGDGHFSPIGGFCKERNLVLVMDVARFKYPTYWVSIDLLWESLLPLDKTSKRSRGWAVLKRNPKIIHAYSQLNVDSETWKDLHNILFQTLPHRISELTLTASILDFCCTFIDSLPEVYESVVENRTLMFSNAGVGENNSMVDEALSNYINGLSELLQKVAKLDLYRYLTIVKSSRIKRVPKFEHPESSNHSSIKINPNDDSSFCSPRKSQIQRLMSLSTVSTRSSLTDLLPIKENLDYGTAFLALFAYALFQFRPELFYLNLKNIELSQKVAEIINVASCTPDVCEEIKLIWCQIDALCEYSKIKP